jgi:hypothetical protein
MSQKRRRTPHNSNDSILVFLTDDHSAAIGAEVVVGDFSLSNRLTDSDCEDRERESARGESYASSSSREASLQ